MPSELESGRDCDALRRLLSTASATLETDRETARACIVRAGVLLDTHSQIAPRVQNEHRGGLAPCQARRVCEYIEAHLDDRISIADLASLAGLSASHFSRAFRQTFGVPPRRHVSIQRVRRAKELILKSQSSLAEVALACGLCDQAHLSRLFRRLVGATPSFWRRQISAA
jgi:AraC family transcriptional regulator